MSSLTFDEDMGVDDPMQLLRDAENRARMTLPPDDPGHGRYTTYANKRCRCDACREAMREYQRQYAERHEAGDAPRSHMMKRVPNQATAGRRAFYESVGRVTGEDPRDLVRALNGNARVTAAVRGHTYVGPGCVEDFVDDEPESPWDFHEEEATTKERQNGRYYIENAYRPRNWGAE